MGNQENETVIDKPAAIDTYDQQEEETEREETEETEEKEEKEFDPYQLYKQDDRGKIIVPLQHEVKTNKRTFTDIHLRAAYGADLRVAGNASNPTDEGLILLERCGEGLTKEAVNKMRGKDIQRCSEVLNFLSQE